MKKFKFSKDQKASYNEIIEWIEADYPDNQFILTGFAGTGKSTLIAKIQKEYELRAAYIAYTGKASVVLKKNLHDNDIDCEYVGTIHGLIYKSVQDEKGNVAFVLRYELETEFDLLIVDEASMIGTKILDDLKSFGIPILFVGDQGQLPPVGDSAGVDLSKPDANLSKIHRQAEGNPIIRFSRDIREGKYIPYGKYDDKVWKFSKSKHREYIDKLLSNYDIERDVFLCGFNRTRNTLNKEVRKECNFTGKTPQIGEKIICLRNNKTLGLFNGMVGIVKTYRTRLYKVKYKHYKGSRTLHIGEFTAYFEETGDVTGLCIVEQFNSPKTMTD